MRKRTPRKPTAAKTATAITATTTATKTTTNAPRIRRNIHAVPLQDLNVRLAAKLGVGNGDAPGGVLQEARRELDPVVDTQLADEHRHQVGQVARAAPLFTHVHEIRDGEITTQDSDEK